MFRHYFKIAIRSLWKNKGFSLLNITGLAIGMACSLLIFLYVKDETSYDRFNRNADRVHRIVKDFINDDGSRIPDATTPAALSPAMQREVPEVEKITRVYPNWGGSWVVKYNEKKFTEEKVYRADSSFFDVFTFPFHKGDPQTAFTDIHSVVITESMAKKYFGDQDPMGKRLTFEPGGDMLVTGVIGDVPEHAHFHFSFLMPWAQVGSDLDQNWGQYNYYTYVKVRPRTDMVALSKKIQGVYERNQKDRYSKFYTQPITAIHLNSHLKWELEANSDKLYVRIFGLIGLFILLIAAINYVNLATAKSSLRAKEIGIRKVSGALRSSLVRQFLLESVITCIIAAILAIGLAQVLSPAVNAITQKHLVVFTNSTVIAYTIAGALVLGLLAGLIPALYLSSFRPIQVLKGFKMNERGALNLRKSLVVLQFTISIVLIIGAVVVAQQIGFLHSAQLGFDKEQMMVIRNAQYLNSPAGHAFLDAARQVPGVTKIGSSNMEMGAGFSTTRLTARGSDKAQQLNYSSVGYDYLDVVNIPIKKGRGFSRQFPADTMSSGTHGSVDQNIGSIIINERAVQEFGLEKEPVGKQLLWADDKDTMYYVTVVGVASDFHFTSLRNEIKPFGFILVPDWQSNFTAKLSTKNITGTIAQLQRLWTATSGSDRPFEYVFLDESFAHLYTAEEQFQQVVISLVILGIFIACLGLLGLATYAAQQRIKEIGIRKTLGASVSGVVALLSKDFLKLVFIGLLIAIPIGWYAMSRWLEGFYYRIHLSWWVFLLAGLAAILVAFATISYQTIRAARANPVKALRTE